MTPARTSAAQGAEGQRNGGSLAQLQAELAAVKRSEAELRALLADAHDQLAQRDEELVRSALAHRRVDDMRQTRVWRMATAYWGARDRARARLSALRERSTGRSRRR